METITTTSAIGYAIGIAGSVAIFFSRVKNENLKDLRERVDILERERDTARLQHIDNQKAISNLEGQLKTYKEIPLKQISSSLIKLADSNNQILSTLQSSAIIASNAAHDGGLLVKTKEGNK
jgi:hypothetical protein